MVIVGWGFTVTVIPAEVAVQAFPFVTITEYVPEVEIVRDGPVCPPFHVYEVPPPAVSITELPEQKVVAPLEVMLGMGRGFTVTVVVAEVAEQPLVLVPTRE